MQGTISAKRDFLIVCSLSLVIKALRRRAQLFLVWAVEQLVGPERRERVSHQTWCGEECFDSRRRVNSDVRRFLLCEGVASGGGQI